MKVSRLEQIIVHTVFIIAAGLCLIPFLLLISASLTNEQSIVQYGYSLLPRNFSIESYRYLLKEPQMIVNAYGISILVTAVGTMVSLLIMTLLAYPISRRDLPFRNAIAFFIFF